MFSSNKLRTYCKVLIGTETSMIKWCLYTVPYTIPLISSNLAYLPRLIKPWRFSSPPFCELMTRSLLITIDTEFSCMAPLKVSIRNNGKNKEKINLFSFLSCKRILSYQWRLLLDSTQRRKIYNNKDIRLRIDIQLQWFLISHFLHPVPFFSQTPSKQYMYDYRWL